METTFNALAILLPLGGTTHTDAKAFESKLASLGPKELVEARLLSGKRGGFCGFRNDDHYKVPADYFTPETKELYEGVPVTVVVVHQVFGSVLTKDEAGEDRWAVVALCRIALNGSEAWPVTIEETSDEVPV